MPRPRFERLPVEKRERILEAAAKEFAEKGFMQASLNTILAKADISKGAAYYYFDDKADLYMTAVQHYSAQLLQDSQFDVDALTIDTFWPTLTDIYRQQFHSFQARPWVLGLTKSAGGQTVADLESGPLAEFWQEIQQSVVQLLQKGQSLGVVRDDLPLDLLLSLLVTVDDVHDRWLFAGEDTAVDVDAAALRIVALLQRLLAPDTL